MIKSNHGSFSFARIIRVLSVLPRGYYSWLGACQQPSKRKRAQQVCDEKVKHIFDDSKKRDGARRIQTELEEQGHRHYIKTIASSMERQGLVAKAGRKFKITTASKHSFPGAPNWLEQNFTANKPNKNEQRHRLSDDERRLVISGRHH